MPFLSKVMNFSWRTDKSKTIVHFSFWCSVHAPHNKVYRPAMTLQYKCFMKQARACYANECQEQLNRTSTRCRSRRSQILPSDCDYWYFKVAQLVHVHLVQDVWSWGVQLDLPYNISYLIIFIVRWQLKCRFMFHMNIHEFVWSWMKAIWR
jgi:hypothetical protein